MQHDWHDSVVCLSVCLSVSCCALWLNNTLVAFITKNPINPICLNSAFVRFYHHDTHYYVVISDNSSVPLIGHLELATGMFTIRHMRHGRGLQKSRLEVRFFSDASEQIWISL